MLPRPIAEPIAARTKPIFPGHRSSEVMTARRRCLGCVTSVTRLLLDKDQGGMGFFNASIAQVAAETESGPCHGAISLCT